MFRCLSENWSHDLQRSLKVNSTLALISINSTHMYRVRQNLSTCMSDELIIVEVYEANNTDILQVEMFESVPLNFLYSGSVLYRL